MGAAEVTQVTWPTTHAAPPIKLQEPASGLLPAFRFATQTLPEQSVVSLALSQPSILDLTADQAQRLQSLLARRYQLLAATPEYAKAPSALPYCFSERKPGIGLATVYVPDAAMSATPSILFLHGYGGSFLWYQHYLSEIFSNHIIICPAYGISAATIPQAYVAECIRAVSNHLGFAISTPQLVGLSAGGFGACQLYVSAPHFYSQMICLGAYPPDSTISRFRRGLRPRFLVGEVEPYVASGEFTRRMDRIRQNCPALEAVTIRGADHFFLVTHPDQSEKCLHQWISADAQANKAGTANGSQPIRIETNSTPAAAGSRH
jgi:pimeloyl-ACP methyl ester carboxylesterase